MVGVTVGGGVGVSVGVAVGVAVWVGVGVNVGGGVTVGVGTALFHFVTVIHVLHPYQWHVGSSFDACWHRYISLYCPYEL